MYSVASADPVSGGTKVPFRSSPRQPTLTALVGCGPRNNAATNAPSGHISLPLDLGDSQPRRTPAPGLFFHRRPGTKVQFRAHALLRTLRASPEGASHETA